MVEEALLLFISALGLVPIPKTSAFVTCINVGILSSPDVQNSWWTVPDARAFIQNDFQCCTTSPRTLHDVVYNPPSSTPTSNHYYIPQPSFCLTQTSSSPSPSPPRLSTSQTCNLYDPRSHSPVFTSNAHPWPGHVIPALKIIPKSSISYRLPRDRGCVRCGQLWLIACSLLR